MAESIKTSREVSILLPIEALSSLDKVSEAINQRRAGVVRAIVIQALRKIERLEQPPATLGDIENAIIK